ncbi:hypothetical protein HRbin04_00005 [archaeon HR04]|nr:hypothetical protein HRbin04_00005 [archaeon HR04]
MSASELDGVIREAYRLVEPSIDDRRRVEYIADIYSKRVKEIAVGYREVSGVVLVGSYAKDTWLAESVDIDIFLKIRPDVDEERFEAVAMDVGLRALHDINPYLRYAQHPYVEAVMDGVRVNVVPCYDVEIGRWRSAADRSPYHTEYMLKALDDAKRREVRLLKRFMKVIGVYGAEIAVEGFSGYVCEVLILKYGSFLNTLKGASRWREKEVIAVDSAMYRGEYGIDGSSNRCSSSSSSSDGSSNNSRSVDARAVRGMQMGNSPIIILDPIDTSRNLGLAISYESVGRFILSARNFLRSPSINYFTYTTADYQRMIDHSKVGNILVVHFKHSPRSEDIIWGQLKSSASAIAKQLSINSFKVLRYTCHTDGSNAFISFMLESQSIPRIVLKHGPKVFDANNAERFISKNRDMLLWISNEDGRLLALAERRFHNARQLIDNIMSNLEGSGISKGLMDDIRSNGFKIYAGEEVEMLMKSSSRDDDVVAVASAVKKIVEYMLVNDRFAFAAE